MAMNLPPNIIDQAEEAARQQGLLADLMVDIFGRECWDDGVEKTSARWIRAMKEFRPHKELDFKFTVFEAQVNQLITVANIEFASLCAHHLFPFTGVCHVGYLPNRLQVGLSKIPRLVHHFAASPQTQERLTHQIAHYLKNTLEAQGVAVIMEATHTCMSARGVREHNGIMRTSEMMGSFLTSGEARNEFLTIIGR